MHHISTSKVQNQNVAIATGHQKTSEAAIEIIKDGGNLIDATIAANYAMMITEPCMASMGGAGMATVSWDGEPVKTLDFFCQTPLAIEYKTRHIDPIQVNFGPKEETYYVGHGTIATPGTMAGLWALHEAGASRPMSVLAEPAIQYCNDGIELNAFQHKDLTLLKNIIALDLDGRYLYMDGKEIKPPKSIIKNWSLGDSLDYISKSDKNEFYIGEIAKLFFEDHRGHGNLVDKDWSNYKAKWSTPRVISRHGHRIFAPDRPSLGGLLLNYFWDQIDAGLPLKRLPSAWLKAYLATRNMRSDYSKLLSYFELDDNIQLVSRGTTHFSIMDDKGNAVSLTSTIGEGAGYFIPNTGIHMNNMLGEEGLLPDGIGSWAPNRRLDTMTTPLIIRNKDDKTIGALGSAGATRIPFISAQCIDRIFAGQSVQESIDAPRIHDDLKTVQIEPNLQDLSMPIGLDAKKWTNTSLYFGGVQCVWLHDSHLESGADKRRDGHSTIIN